MNKKTPQIKKPQGKNPAEKCRTDFLFFSARCLASF